MCAASEFGNEENKIFFKYKEWVDMVNITKKTLLILGAIQWLGSIMNVNIHVKWEESNYHT